MGSEPLRTKKFMKAYLLIILTAFLVVSSAFGQNKQRILIFGDSITAGYGLETEQAFPALLQKKVDSLGLNYTVINGGLSGETSAGGLRRIDWVLQRPVDIMVLELGGNDGLRGIDLTSTKKNLQQIIDKALAKNSEMKIIIAGMQVPPNLGADYANQFAHIFPDLAKDNDLKLIPFILEGVGGNPNLNLPDGIHPTAEGHKILAENVWDILRPIL